MQINSADVTWTWSSFDELTPSQLYEALALRAQVFVVEQECVFLDPDRYDYLARHLFGIMPDGQLVAYLRLLQPDTRYKQPSIGRVVVARDARAAGLGRLVMLEGLKEAARIYPDKEVRISAQLYLASFYESFGFRQRGEPYDEDGIPHIEMEWHQGVEV